MVSVRRASSGHVSALSRPTAARTAEPDQFPDRLRRHRVVEEGPVGVGPALPVEPEASFPPPAWTAPVELKALFEPPEMPAGAPTVAVWLPVVAVAAGSTDCGEDWTTPVEPDASFAPPDCAAPVELEALFPPPAVETGAVALAVAVLS